jgi:hypothetical protein
MCHNAGIMEVGQHRIYISLAGVVSSTLEEYALLVHPEYSKATIIAVAIMRKRHIHLLI